MKKSRVIQSGFRTMVRHKLRTFFMMIGIVVGVTALTLVFSLGKGAEEEIMGKIEKLFGARNIIVGGGSGRLMGGPPAGGEVPLDLDDMEALQAEIRNIEMWDPMQIMTDQDVKHRDKTFNTTIYGQSPRAETVWNRGVTRGEFIDGTDMLKTARVALIGETAAEELFGDADPIGRQIRIGSVPFRVKGILRAIGVDPHGMDRDRDIMVPITTILRRLMNVDYIKAAKIQVVDPEQMAETVTQITSILRERHHRGPGEPDDFTLITPVRVREMVADANKMFNVFLPLIVGIALIVGAVIVANLMLIGVNERTGEIGLRKAVGARGKDILLQFLMETTVVTVTGGLIGLLLGALGVRAMVTMMGLPAVLSWKAVVLGIGSSALVGFAAGVFPARRAAAFDPVETLR